MSLGPNVGRPTAGLRSSGNSPFQRSADAARAKVDSVRGPSQPQTATPADLGSALGSALGSDPAKAASGRDTLRKLAAEGMKSQDPTVKNLASAANHVLKGLDLLDKQPQTKMDTFKAVMEFGMAGPEAVKAGLEALKQAKGLDPEAVRVLNQMGGSLVSGLGAFTEVCQSLDQLREGNVREALKHLSSAAGPGFQTIRPFLEACEIDKKKLDAIQGLMTGGSQGINKILDGLDAFDKGNYSAALSKMFEGGGQTLVAAAPLLAEGAGKYAKFFGPLARAGADLAEAGPDIVKMLDKNAPYADRLGAAQMALSTIGTAGIRGLASVAFGDKIGNAMADTCKWVAKTAIDYDQETAKRWAEAGKLEDSAWNRGANFGKDLAKTLGWDGTNVGDANNALSLLDTYWASSDPKVREPMTQVLKTLREFGPEAARDRYLRLTERWNDEQFHQQLREPQ